jgi:cytochrome c biogenesis factor
MYYNGWNFPLAAILMASIIGLSLRDRIKTKALVGTVAGSLATGAILAVVKWPTPDLLANLGLPLLAVGLVIVIYDLILTATPKQRTIRALGRKILFLGMIIGLIGILFSAAGKQIQTITNIQFNNEGIANIQALGMSLSLRDWTTYPGQGQVYSPEFNSTVPEHSTASVTVEAKQSGNIYRDSIKAVLYTNSGPMAIPTVIHTIQGDIYLHLEITDPIYNSLLQGLMGMGSSPPSEISMTISTVPYVYLLWIGVAIICAGICLYAIEDSQKKSP